MKFAMYPTPRLIRVAGKTCANNNSMAQNGYVRPKLQGATVSAQFWKLFSPWAKGDAEPSSACEARSVSTPRKIQAPDRIALALGSTREFPKNSLLATLLANQGQK